MNDSYIYILFIIIQFSTKIYGYKNNKIKTYFKYNYLINNLKQNKNIPSLIRFVSFKCLMLTQIKLF